MKQKKFVSTSPILRDFGGDLSKKWYLEWYDERGRRNKRFSPINEGVNVEERHRLAAALKVKIETGLISRPIPSDSLIKQHLLPYFERHCVGLREDSVRDYKSIFRSFEKWLLANGYKHVPAKRFGAADADRYARHMEVLKKSNATFNKHISLLNTLFLYLVKEDVMPRSPFEFIKRKTKNSRPLYAFKPHNMELVREELKKTNVTAYLACMLDMYAFLRPKECRHLRIKDIDLGNNLIHTRKEWSKNKKEECVVIMPGLRQILLDYLGESVHQPTDYLLTKMGKPGDKMISPKYVLAIHHRIMTRLGFDKTVYKPYSWKHTGNSISRVKGASLAFLQKQNRHASQQQTETYLQSVTIEEVAKGQERFFDF